MLEGPVRRSCGLTGASTRWGRGGELPAVEPAYADQAEPQRHEGPDAEQALKARRIEQKYLSCRREHQDERRKAPVAAADPTAPQQESDPEQQPEQRAQHIRSAERSSGKAGGKTCRFRG